MNNDNPLIQHVSESDTPLFQGCGDAPVSVRTTHLFVMSEGQVNIAGWLKIFRQQELHCFQQSQGTALDIQGPPSTDKAICNLSSKGRMGPLFFWLQAQPARRQYGTSAVRACAKDPCLARSRADCNLQSPLASEWNEPWERLPAH